MKALSLQEENSQEQVLCIGRHGTKVRSLHKELRQLGFKIPPIESLMKRFDKGTAELVAEFQKTHGLEPSGLVDKATAEILQMEAERARRHYKFSQLPVLRLDPPPPLRREILLALYTEICNSWRMLTDVRFKLLGFVPTASIVLLIGLLSKGAVGEGLSATSRLAICMVGLLVTIGLYIYDRRNTKLYDDLVSRGRRIEAELGIDTGQFLGRRDPSGWLIKHDTAINLIYGSAIIAWFFAVYATWMGLV